MPQGFMVEDTNAHVIQVFDTDNGSGEALSQADFFAILALLQSRGKISATPIVTNWQPDWAPVSPPGN